MNDMFEPHPRTLIHKTMIAAVVFGQLWGCEGAVSTLALEEPVRVSGAQFHAGELPHRADAATPRLTSIETSNRVIRPGQPGKVLSGRVSADALSVGLRLSDVGSGYWTMVVGAPDPFANGELGFRALLDFGRDVSPGLHSLQLVAFDHEGRPGPRMEASLCFPPPWPDNLNACDADSAPPAAVLTLWWDTEVDLDLQLVTPEGKRLDSKHPSTAASPGSASMTSVGVLDRDSNARCVLDGARRESVVWQETPPPGVYSLYVNLYDACHVPERSVRFSATLLTSQQTGEGGRRRLVEVPDARVDGQLLDVDQNGGAKIGMYVTTYTFQVSQ